MNIKQAKKIYMIGIKGVGMTMLAQFLVAKGKKVQGSDIGETFMTDQILKDNNIKFFENFNENNIPADIDIIIYSTAYNVSTNVEVAKAFNSKKKVLTYAEALGEIFNSQYGIAVTGTHGKTTTTAWLGYVLKQAGKSPSVMVGARVPQFKGASLIGKSDYLIIEADEYQNKLKNYQPQAILLNNIDHDHHDFFPTLESYKQVFIDFIKKIPKKGFLVANFDDPVIRKVAAVNTRGKVIGYAINDAADYIAYDIKQAQGRQYFKVKIGIENFFADSTENNINLLGDFSIRLSGRHNIYNALAVIASAIELDVALSEIRTYLEEFSGTARRMEVLGEFRGALIIDDYAHHPVEIITTLKGVRELYGNRKLRVVFHPHTYTRTKALINEFAKSFGEVNELIVLDIYGSAREEQGGVHSQDLIKKIQASKFKPQKVLHIPTLEETEEYLRESIERDDIILLMGAGDVFRVGNNLVKN